MRRRTAFISFNDSSPGCIQRINLSTGAVAWQMLDEDWYSFSSNGYTGLQTESAIYFNDGNELLAVNKSTGALQTILNDEDYEFLPLALDGGTLLVRARRTRWQPALRTARGRPASGEVLWQTDMAGAEPIDPPNEMSGLVDKEFFLPGRLTWRMGAGPCFPSWGEPNLLAIQTLDPATGTLGSELIARARKPSRAIFTPSRRSSAGRGTCSISKWMDIYTAWTARRAKCCSISAKTSSGSLPFNICTPSFSTSAPGCQDLLHCNDRRRADRHPGWLAGSQADGLLHPRCADLCCGSRADRPAAGIRQWIPLTHAPPLGLRSL